MSSKMIQSFKKLSVWIFDADNVFVRSSWRRFKIMDKPLSEKWIILPSSGVWAVKVSVVTNVTGTLWEDEVGFSILNVTKGRKEAQSHINPFVIRIFSRKLTSTIFLPKGQPERYPKKRGSVLIELLPRKASWTCPDILILLFYSLLFTGMGQGWIWKLWLT